MKWALAVAFSLLGCGGGGGHDYADDVQGNWIAGLSDVCAMGVNFVGAGFSWNVICVNGSTVELRTDQGTFEADGEKIYVTLSRSTCADAQKKFYMPYSVGVNSLTLLTTEQALLFAPNPGGTGSGAATFGCFRNGAFVPSPLAPI